MERGERKCHATILEKGNRGAWKEVVLGSRREIIEIKRDSTVSGGIAADSIRRRDHRQRRRSEGKSREHSGVYAQREDHLVIRGLDSFFCRAVDEQEGEAAAPPQEQDEEEAQGFLVN